MTHRAPTSCPVCSSNVRVTRVGCPSCGSELAGDFKPCDFCALDATDLEILRVFLASRGNMRELEKHLGVSYPTARSRFTTLLLKLGLSGGPEESVPETQEGILAQVATGDLDPGVAAKLIEAIQAQQV